MRQEVREILRERTKRKEAVKWADLLSSQGWSSWQDAAEWVIERNGTWAMVAEIFGLSANRVWTQACAAGVTGLDRTPTRQRQMVMLARQHMAETGSLRDIDNELLASWLRDQRRLVSGGARMLVHAELDGIDPEWAKSGRSRPVSTNRRPIRGQEGPPKGTDPWLLLLARHGWSSWADAAAWARAENAGFEEIAQRLQLSVDSVRKHVDRAGVDLPAPLTEQQLEYLQMARSHAAARGDLYAPRPPKLVDWLARQRLKRNGGARSRVYSILDDLDPDWMRSRAERPARPCDVDGCTATAGTRGHCPRHRDASYRARRKAEAAKAAGFPEDTPNLGNAKQRARADREWEERFAREGWTGWPDAIAWALETNAGWTQVAERLGVGHDRAQRRAMEAGYTMLPRLSPAAWRRYNLAVAHVEAHGDLSGPLSSELNTWLYKRRVALGEGRQARVVELLNDLDPAWASRRQSPGPPH